MDRIVPRSSRGRYRLGAALSLVLALFGGFLAFAPNAFAHHPTISGSTSCNTDGAGYLVDFTSVSWQQSGGNTGGGANPHIDVYYRQRTGNNGQASAWVLLPWQSTYKYTQQNGYQFADTFPLADLSGGDQIQLEARAAASWGNGTAGGQATDSSWLTFPTDCQPPGVPAVSSGVACTSGDGTITVTLQNTGGPNAKVVHFVVTDPRTSATTAKDVGPGATDTVVLTGFADGAVTIPVTADGIHHDQKLTVACDRPGVPEVSATVACSNGNGDVTVVLKNTGGDLPVTFVVTDPRTSATTTRTVAVGATDSVVLTGFADGAVTIPVTANGKAVDQTVTVTCDRPGVPEVSATVACSNADGDVTVVLKNTGGDLPVTFVVTDPRTNATTTRTVAVGATDSVVLTGFADGTVTIPVTANGKAANQTVTVHCDVPGVPSVTSGVTCADVQGVVTVNLANTGGNQPITFVVTDPRTSTSTTKIVAPGANTTVTLTGFADGVYTIPVTADGVSIAQTVTVKCHSPGVPSVVVAESCTNFDGDVTVTLGNTGGTDPIHFVVTDPRGGAPIVRDVAVGASTTVTLTGFTDGQWIIGITADGKAIAKTVTVACDRPGVPAVYHDVECGELGGKVVVTLKNTSPAGTAEPIVFEVTDPRDGSKTLVTLAAGDAGTVTLNQLADGDYTIPVSADGTALEPVTVTVDCQQPAVGGISTSCADGGEVVSLSNDGGSPVTLLVTKDGVKVKDVVVPAKGTNEVLVPFDNGQTAVIAVSDGPHVLLTETVTHSCVDPTTTTTTSTPSSTTTTPSGPSTTVAPGDTTPTVQVLGNEVTRAATTGTLPTTGSNTTGLVLFGLSLIAFGACMVQVSRKRG